MRRLANVITYTLAALGLFVLIANGVFAVQRHYAVTCVDDSDDEGFTIRTHRSVSFNL